MMQSQPNNSVKNSAILAFGAAICWVPYLLSVSEYCASRGLTVYCLVGLQGFDSIFDWSVIFMISSLYMYSAIFLTLGAAVAAAGNRTYLARVRGGRAITFHLFSSLILLLMPGSGGIRQAPQVFFGLGDNVMILSQTGSLLLLLIFVKLNPVGEATERPKTVNGKRNFPLVEWPFGLIGLSLFIIYLFFIVALTGIFDSAVTSNYKPPHWIFVPYVP